MDLQRMSKLGDPLPFRVVVLRALQLGDLLTAVPALRSLRAALPHAEITLVGLPWSREFVARFYHYLDRFIEFPGFPGLPERPLRVQQIPKFLIEMQKGNFDLGLQMQGSGELANPLVMLFGARFNAGFYLPWQYCPDKERFLSYPDNLPEVKRHLALMEHLGIPSQGEDLEFPIDEVDREDFHRTEGISGFTPGGYACIHPGSRSVERRWPEESFAVVADHLAEQGLRIVLTGTPEECELAGKVSARMRHPAINLCGKTSLGSLGVLLSGARLLVCNDTGVSHVAAALGIPSVVLFTGSDPDRWAPLNRELHRIIPSAKDANPAVVVMEAEELLKKERVHAL